jgi:protein-tyrosine phosphatase
VEPIGAGTRKRIVVVCYGNICRSPTAEALLKQTLRQTGLERAYAVRSAGVGAQPGTPVPKHALEVARANGLDLSTHRARRLTAEMAREAEHLIALDEVVEEEIAILAGDVGVALWPVDDPYGGSRRSYERAFAEIQSHVAAFVATLRSRAATP